MKDTDLYSRRAPRGLLPTSLWTRPVAEWTSMLSILPASAGTVRPVAANWLAGVRAVELSQHGLG